MVQGITKAHCNRCHIITNHDIIGLDKWESGDQHDSEYVYELSEMLKCRGCETVTLRLTLGGPEHERPTVVFYPPAMARRIPEWAVADPNPLYLIDDDVACVPHGLWHLMREVYVAVQNGAATLATMGIRAALESVMIDKVGDKGSFANNMDAFQAAGYLSLRQRGHLETVLAAGHAAIHRGWTPRNDSDIVVLLDIAEAIIEGAYLHDQPADALGRRIPRKPPRSAQSSQPNSRNKSGNN